ncbi:MAG: coiled-coil domain-containing protein [Mangrovibacterium sp.]
MSETEEPKAKFSLGKTDKDRRNNLIVIFLSVVLVIVIVLLIIQRSEHSKIVSSLNLEKESLQNELNGMVQNYDALKTDNDTLNSELFVARTRVKDLMVEIGQLKKASYAQISKYQEEVGSLRRIMRDYIMQVDSLNRRNQQLLQENQQVKQDYMEVENRNKALQEEKEQLSQRVERAAQLEALGLTVTAINKKGSSINNREKAEKLVISFTLSKNVTARRGNKNIYLRILRPDQILLTKSNKDLFQFEDLRIPYSAVREVTYEGNELPVNIYWDNLGEEPFMPGVYTIDVFADGNNIGTTTFSFKK